MLTGRLFSQRLDRSKPLWELWLVQGLEDNRFAVINKTHHCLVDGVSGVDITTVLFDTSPTPTPVGPEPWSPRSRAVGRGARREGSGGPRAVPVAARAPGAARRTSSHRDVRRAARGGRGPRQHRVEVREPAAPDAAQRADRPAPARAVDPHAAEGPESDQERAGRNGQRRVPGCRVGRARPHAEAARCAHRGPRAARHRPGVGARGERARRARQPHHRDARSAARVRGRRARAPSHRERGDEGAEGVQAGGRRGGAHAAAGLRASDDPGAGFPAQLLGARVQPARHERARARSSRCT